MRAWTWKGPPFAEAREGSNAPQLHQPVVGGRRGRRWPFRVQRPGAGVHLRHLPEADHGRYGMAAGHRIIRVVVRRDLLRSDGAAARPDDGPLEHSPGRIARPRHLCVRHVPVGAQPEIFGDFHPAVCAGRSGQCGSNPDRLCQGDLGLVRPPARAGARHRDVGGRAGRFHHAATGSDADRTGGLARRLSDPRTC